MYAPFKGDQWEVNLRIRKTKGVRLSTEYFVERITNKIIPPKQGELGLH